MKKLNQLKIKDYHQITDNELKLILGGSGLSDSAYVTCTANAKNTGCTVETGGKACKEYYPGYGYMPGTCSFHDKNDVTKNKCFCKLL